MCSGIATIAEAVRQLGIGVATGEHCANRVMFKQLLQARAIDFCQIDSCRLGGVNENLAVILMAAKFGVPVCPHAGGVGLCECVQHLSMFDYIAVSARWTAASSSTSITCTSISRIRCASARGRYLAPSNPGYSITIRPESRSQHRYPEGAAWTTTEDRQRMTLRGTDLPTMTYPRIATLKTAGRVSRASERRPASRWRSTIGWRAPDASPLAQPIEVGRRARRQSLLHPADGRVGRHAGRRAERADAPALASISAPAAPS